MKSTNRPTIPCISCDGKGAKALADQYWNVLMFLRRMKKLTAADIQELLPKGSVPTLANKRLEYLRKKGFATRTIHKASHSIKPIWVYSPTT